MFLNRNLFIGILLYLNCKSTDEVHMYFNSFLKKVYMNRRDTLAHFPILLKYTYTLYKVSFVDLKKKFLLF